MNDGHFEIKIENITQKNDNNNKDINYNKTTFNLNVDYEQQEQKADDNNKENKIEIKKAIIDEIELVESKENGGDEIEEENEDRKRFQIELEFVQSLGNPDYLNYLAQRGYFKNETFLNYLKYLMYWKEPEYVKYITYPQCLALLDLLQHEQFLKEIANTQCAKYINDQLLLLWLHYKRTREWIKYDPTKLPNNIIHLINIDTNMDTNTNDSI